jgi:hypothetical protein
MAEHLGSAFFFSLKPRRRKVASEERVDKRYNLFVRMEHQIPRHQCLIYEGPPSRHLVALAAVIRQKLSENYRCLYLDSHPMVAGMRSYLAAAGVDVAEESAKKRLVLSSDRDHLIDGCRFDLDGMMRSLQDALVDALDAGFAGLWATGDMTWEVGPDKDFSKLLEYEWRLEEFIREHPQMGGVCQYHIETMPRKILRHGVVSHPSIFINQTLSMINPIYRHSASFASAQSGEPEMDSFINRILEPQILA